MIYTYKYLADTNNGSVVQYDSDGNVVKSFIANTENKDCAEIMRQVEAGELTIEEAEENE